MALKPQPPNKSRGHDEALQRAAFALQTGRPADAEKIAGDILKKNPGDAAAAQIFGHAMFMQGRGKDAVAVLERAARQSRDPAVETQLAVALAQAGRNDDAVNAFTLAIAHEPPFPPAFLEYGNLLAALGRDGEAIDVLTRGLALAPQVGQFAIQLGFLFAARHERAKARDMLARGLSGSPPQPHAMVQLARLMQSDRDFAQAADVYRALLKMTPGDPVASLGLGACLLELGQEEAAYSYLRAAARGGAKLSSEVLTVLAASGRGRFWLKPSDAARFLDKS